MYNLHTLYLVVIGNVCDELTKSLWTIATVLHSPVQVDFYALP